MGVRQTVQAKLDKVLLPFTVFYRTISAALRLAKVSNSTVQSPIKTSTLIYRIDIKQGWAHTATGMRANRSLLRRCQIIITAI